MKATSAQPQQPSKSDNAACDSAQRFSSRQRIKHMSLEMEEKANTGVFSYEPVTKDGIRLIRVLPRTSLDEVHCEIENYDNYFRGGYGTMKYAALSYCWGDTSCARSITLNGAAFEVAPNLWLALVAIHQHHKGLEHLWVDALCINQNDLSERNEQVYGMWRIYAYSQRVLAWVGTDNEYTELAVAAMHGLAQSCQSEEVPCSGWRDDHLRLTSDKLNTLKTIRDRPYFDRAWIIQEFLQAPTLSLICGPYEVDVQTLYHCQRVWSGSQAEAILQSRKQEMHLCVDRNNRNTYRHCTEVAVTLDTLLRTYRHSQCSDRRDRLFAMLGNPTFRRLERLLGIQEGFRPNYYHGSAETLIQFGHYCDYLIARTPVQSAANDKIMPSHYRSIYKSLLKALDDETRPGSLLRELGDLQWKDLMLSATPDGSGSKVQYGPFLKYVHRKVEIAKSRQPKVLLDSKAAIQEW